MQTNPKGMQNYYKKTQKDTQQQHKSSHKMTLNS